MIKILKGDTSADISFALAEGFDYSGATVHVEYQGAVKTFTGCAAGDVLALRFSADETAVMSLGSYPVVVRITNPSGMVKTIQNATTKICVTDDPSEVSGGVIALDVKGMLYGIEDLPERWTESDIVAKLREIMRRGGAVLCALLTFSAFGASVQTARKDAIWNDAQIVTSVTFDGLATTNDVCNIVTNEVQSFGDWVEEWEPFHYGSVYSFSGPYYEGGETWSGFYHPKKGMGVDMSFTAAGGEFATRLVFVGDAGGTSFTVTLTRSHVAKNALGLARMSDIAAHTNRMDNPHGVTAAQVGAYTKEQTDGAISAATGGLASAESVAGLATTNDTAALGRSVDALWRYTFGDRAWIAVTNYMRTVEGVVPSLQLWEVRDGATNCVYSSGEEIAHVVSNEVGRIALVFSNLIEGVRAQIPSTAWSAYQSRSGAPNPASNEVTVVSTPSVMLTGGAEWQQYVDVSSNSLWVLSSKGVTIAGSDTNGYFRIFDAEGNAAFEVVKEMAMTVPAMPQGITPPGGTGTMSVTFIANAQPTLYLSPTLGIPFVEESKDTNASVTWTDNRNGTWTAEVDFVNVYDRYFAYATFVKPGATVVRNNAPMRVDGGIVTSDGKKIKPVVVGSAVSWEVVE